jgi:hypothetical protein
MIRFFSKQLKKRKFDKNSGGWRCIWPTNRMDTTGRFFYAHISKQA